MKNLLFFGFCFVHIFMNAQDTIYKRTGEIISAKVIEVNIKEISYKRSDLLEGPLFVINKNEIKKIKYLTGSVDSFSVAKPVVQNTLVYQSDPRVAFMESNQIYPTLSRGKYVYKGHTISDRYVLSLAFKKNLIWNDKEVSSNIISSRRNKNLQYAIGFGGAALGVIALLGSASAAGESSGANNDAAAAGIVALASVGVLVSSQIVSFTYKLKKIKNANRVAELYNQHSKN